MTVYSSPCRSLSIVDSIILHVVFSALLAPNSIRSLERATQDAFGTAEWR